MPVRYAPRRRPPPPARPAWILASMGTFQLTVGQNLGHAVQIQRLPTPSWALCLETHQTRPYPRNHRPEPVRTCSRRQSGRTFPGRLTIPTCLPAPRAAVGNHSKSALRQQRSARRYKSQPLWYAASRSSIQLIRTCCRARMPCASRLAAREPVPTVARVQWRVAWVPCAARSAQAAGNLARDPPTDPRRSLFLACATSAGPGCAGWPRCAAITHRLPGSRPATPTKPVSPTLCGGPGDARWVHGRRPCLGRRQIGSKARGNTSSCINQVKSPDQEPGLTRLSTMQPAVVALLPGRALPHLGRCLRLQRPSHCRAITAIGTAAAVAALSLQECPSPGRRPPLRSDRP